MRTNGAPRQLWALAIAATILTTAVLSGCGANPPGPGSGVAAASTPSNAPATKDDPSNQPPQAPNDPNSGQVPTNVPEPIPQPNPPADPKLMNVKAVANTDNINALYLFNANVPSVVAIYVTLGWSKVNGAAQYRVSRNDDPTDKDDKGNPKYYLRANVPGNYKAFHDGGVMNLKIGNTYSYLVEALNTSGQVIAKGTDTATPLYPLNTPNPTTPANNADQQGIRPQFGWDAMQKVDGYYVEVFSGTNFLPMYRGYRQNEMGNSISYGDAVDAMPGTAPIPFSGILNPAGNYIWMVTAVKTDTGNASTAKAWAKSNSVAMRFWCGKKPAAPIPQGGN